MSKYGFFNSFFVKYMLEHKNSPVKPRFNIFQKSNKKGSRKLKKKVKAKAKI